ncbi:MAG TPA: hypothetical protein VEH75_05825 [Xanthobacteraceae bacterium]|nr:hypothetical protein [Xanthobacteraceae bacterium]
MSRFSDRRRYVLAAALAGGSLLAACSDIYYDRRDTVSFAAGDAQAVNRVTHAVDMWPEAAGYRDIVSNGQKIQGAVERYRTNKVTPPVGMDTSNISPTQQQAAPATGPTVSP